MTGKIKVYIEPCAGLGNRMNFLLSMLYWQSIMPGRIEIVLVWKRETACNADFGTLFEPITGLRVINLYEMGLRSKYALPTLCDRPRKKLLMRGKRVYEHEELIALLTEGGEEAIGELLRTAKQDLYLRNNSGLCSWEHMGSQTHLLVPSLPIRARLAEVFRPFEGKQVIGMHIRRTDHVEAIEESPLELFTSKAKEYQDSVCYLATDDESVIGEMASVISLIPHRPFAQTVRRDTPSGIMDALLDMLCLSKCEVIYGSFGSTFSAIASNIGKCKLEILSLHEQEPFL